MYSGLCSNGTREAHGTATAQPFLNRRHGRCKALHVRMFAPTPRAAAAAPVDCCATQVVSVFTSFGFKWPGQLKKLYSAASMSSFSEQLMAPECSVGTWGFQAKCVLVCSGLHVVIHTQRGLPRHLFQALPRAALSRRTEVCAPRLAAPIA